MIEAPPRGRWRFHRYVKYGFVDDLDTVRRIAIGRLGSVRLAVTPTVWLQVPLFFLLGIVLTYLPGRLALGSAFGDRAADALQFALAGLTANVVHALGHIVSGTLAGSPMDALLLTATRDANIYLGDQSAVRGRCHIARAIGGPAANQIVAALATLAAPGFGGALQPLLVRLAGVNLAFGLGSLLPLPSVDGEVIWREVWRGLRGRRFGVGLALVGALAPLAGLQIPATVHGSGTGQGHAPMAGSSADDSLGHLFLPALLRGSALTTAVDPPSTSPSPMPSQSPTPFPSASQPPSPPLPSPSPSPSPPATPSPSPPATPVLKPGPGFFVAPTADGTGDGSFAHPWTIQQALNQPAALTPGDVVWLRGGTYTATLKTDASLGRISFACLTHGTADAPIVFRNYRDERVTLDGQDNEVVLFDQECSHTWFWGLEVMSSAPVRTPSRSYIYGTAQNVRFINMVLHDLADGIDLWTAATNAELYGSLVYHNGWDETNGGHGHGIYTQNNNSGVKHIQDNIFFSQYGYNIKVWSTNQFVDNYVLEGNIAFNGGSLSEYASRKFNFFVVGNNPSAPARNLVVRNNYTFAGRTTTTPACNAFGPNYGVVDMLLEGNLLLGQFRTTGPYVNCSIKHNRILGGTALPFISGPGFAMTDYPENDYAQDLPTTGLDAFVRPNRYEPGRANIAIYNWSGADTVDVDIGGVGLNPGDRYQLIHAMDFYKDIITDTYRGGGTIKVPMTGHSFAQAIGSTKSPVSQFPQFGAFVIRRVGAEAPVGQAPTGVVARAAPPDLPSPLKAAPLLKDAPLLKNAPVKAPAPCPH